jgi:Predicted membrane protein (DUF2127)
LSVSSKAAAAFFLLSHGTVKLVLVLAVMRGWAWAYPAFVIALGLLIGYQSAASPRDEGVADGHRVSEFLSRTDGRLTCRALIAKA